MSFFQPYDLRLLFLYALETLYDTFDEALFFRSHYIIIPYIYKIAKTDEEWRKILTPQQYKITREKGTEAPFTGEYYTTKEPGTYVCMACGNELFPSDTKYESGSGWPSFWKPAKEEHLELNKDDGHGMERTEVMCSRCGSHLGHVFDDGPQPTEKRYCINSASLILKKDNPPKN